MNENILGTVIIFFIFLQFLISKNAYSQGFWIETNLNYSYRMNDFYVKGYENYHIVGAGVRGGYAFILTDPKVVLQFYISGYPVYDLSNNRWNRVDWHNNYVYGVGSQFRIKPENFFCFKPRDFYLEIFAEKTWITYCPNEFFFTGHRPSDDFKSGLRYWLSLTGQESANSDTQYLKKKIYIWLDSAGAFFYAKSSFYNVRQTGFYLVNLSNRFGLGFDTSVFWPIEMYFAHHLYLDLGQNEWNKLDWNNRYIFGGGLRLKHLRFFKHRPKEINIELYPYLEMLWILYNEKVSYVPSYRPTFDIQAGLSFWLSFSQ